MPHLAAARLRRNLFFESLLMVRRKGLVCIFSHGMGENYGFAPSSRREQQSTGLLHLSFRVPSFRYNIKRVIPNGITLLMVRRKGLEPPTY